MSLEKEKKEEKQDGVSKKKTWNKLGSKRGVDTLMRTTYRTQVDLTGVADSKANIMISINGIILSIIIATVAPRVADLLWLAIPTGVLLLTCVATLVFSVLSAIPRITKRAVTLEQVAENKANLLFFGHFSHLTQDQFIEGMQTILHDRDLVYHNMLRDIYNAGTVLGRKFVFLRIAYIIFIVGIVLSMALYVMFFILMA